MKINGKQFHTIWLHPKDPAVVLIIDQRWLPHKLVVEELKEVQDFAVAIKDMHIRGAPLIGATAAFGMYTAALTADESTIKEELKDAASLLKATRPTAVNLGYALEKSLEAMMVSNSKAEIVSAALEVAKEVKEESIDQCYNIGLKGLPLIEKIAAEKGNQPVNILTHCNAGWMACVDYGTATAPIYLAHDKGIPVHVWVDETRPRNQGARITAFELKEHGVPHTVITDNTGGHLMQHKMVDLVIVGTDRTTRTGDVANKIGTYLKALAAKDNGVPFYVAAPSSSIDWGVRDGLKEIPIEKRGDEEVKYIQGLSDSGLEKVLLTPSESPALNYGFDVTPSRLVSGLITERGICDANEKGIAALFPEKMGLEDG